MLWRSYIVIFIINFHVDSTAISMVEFLKNHKLHQYIPIFSMNDVDSDMLLQSTDKDLEEIGVSNPIHRLKISFEMKRQMLGKQSSVCPSHVVAEMFRMNDGLETFCCKVIENELDAEIIKDASDAVFIELGVTNKIINISSGQL